MSDYGTPPPPPPPPPGGFQQPGYGQAPTGAPLAVWIQRVGAYLLDYVLIVPFSILQVVFSPKTVTTNVNGVVNTTQSGGNLSIAFLMAGLGLAVWFFNRCYLGGQGQSFGKKVLGLTLIGERTGQPIGMGRAFLRDLAHFVDAIICYVGYLFPLWDQKRQTLADKIMTTVVTSKA